MMEGKYGFSREFMENCGFPRRAKNSEHVGLSWILMFCHHNPKAKITIFWALLFSRLAHLYNESLLLTFSNDVRNINVYSNKCPMMLYPLRKLSITKLLQILAKKRAENCSFMFIEGLLTNYSMPNRPAPEMEAAAPETVEEKQEMTLDQAKEDEKITQLLTAQDSISSDTSIEIYRWVMTHAGGRCGWHEPWWMKMFLHHNNWGILHSRQWLMFSNS